MADDADPPLVGLPVLLGFAARCGRNTHRGCNTSLAGGPPHGSTLTVSMRSRQDRARARRSGAVRAAGRPHHRPCRHAWLSMVADIAIDAVAAKVRADPVHGAQPTFRWGRRRRTDAPPLPSSWLGGSAPWSPSSVASCRTTRLHRSAGLSRCGSGLFVANALVPHAPVFLPPRFDVRNANWWEVLYALAAPRLERAARRNRADRKSPAVVTAGRSRPPRAAAQGRHRHLRARHRRLGRSGRFLKELDGGLEAIAGVLPIKDHMVRLINSRETVETRTAGRSAEFPPPVHAIATVMDKDEDVLMLLMTSHGGQTGFALQLPSGHGRIDAAAGQLRRSTAKASRTAS